MRIQKATERYEAWLAGRLQIVEPDLATKHRKMGDDVFSFLRATFYRWCQLFAEKGGADARAHEVLAVGDLHVENFGTWRDREGRLVWGINDFDEACRMPWTIDLVRLAVSAHLAIDDNGLRIDRKEACQAILEGYRAGLKEGGRPFVLAEHNTWLRDTTVGKAQDPVAFWKKIDAAPAVAGAIPRSARESIERMLPDEGLSYRLVHRTAGLGSLGRRRFAAIGEWHGGRICREVKELVPSAWNWASGHPGRDRIELSVIARRSIRCPDPFLAQRGRWVVRRLAPDCMRIELSSLPRRRDESRLLYSMGFETANVHLGTKGARTAITRELELRKPGWLHATGKVLVEATRRDWLQWRRDPIA